MTLCLRDRRRDMRGTAEGGGKLSYQQVGVVVLQPAKAAEIPAGMLY